MQLSLFMPFLRLLQCAAVGTLLGTLQACAVLEEVNSRGVVYVPEVVQGNFVSKEQKEALQIGMSRMQVQGLLGAPLLVSPLHEGRWDYVFTVRRQGSRSQMYKLTLLFSEDKLSAIKGDSLPSETEFVGRLIGRKSAVKVPDLQASPEVLQQHEQNYSAVNVPEQKAPSPTLPSTRYPSLE